MKKYIFISSLFLTNLLYSSTTTYQIVDSVSVDTNGCKYHYPVLISSAPDSCVKKINTMLRGYFSYIMGDCCGSEYSILFDSDSLVCFEFRIRNKFKVSYYSSVCINPTKAEIVLPMPFLNRKKLRPFVQKFYREDSSQVYGSKAYYYGGGGGADIVYGISNSKLVLYMGGEGHHFGHDRLEIPLAKLGFNIYKMNEEEIENFRKKYGEEFFPANYGGLFVIY